ncbi:MAG: Flp family type IVb pilin [Coriobacteriia bacterium]|nr:Flp family type IVb pilin [Coriobacteriia bacterium]
MLTKLYVRTRNWAESEEGATAVEYGLMVALIAVAIVGTVLILGQTLDGVFNIVVDALPGS